MKIVCETEHLVIRHLQLEDAEFIVRLFNEESFIRYIADKNVRTTADAENYLSTGPLESYKTQGFGSNLVILKSTGEPIGTCGLFKREELKHPDIGYAFLPEYCGNGFATEAALSVLNDGITNQALKVIWAVTLPDNLGSNALLRKVGFERVGDVELYDSQNNLYEYRA